MGKTHTVSELLRLVRASGEWRCAGMKPICCGDRHDAELLLEASTGPLMVDQLNPVWLKTPAAPFTAALTENVTIDIEQILRAFRFLEQRLDYLFVEGVGGWMVPIRSDYFVSDLAVNMQLPVLVVVRNRLGCLNHTALTVRSIRSLGLTCAGIVLNQLPGDDDVSMATNAEVLRQILGAPVLPALTEKTTELSAEWRSLFQSCVSGQVSAGHTQL